MKFRDYSNYEVFEDGRIWSYKKKRFMKPKTNNSGYQLVFLSNEEEKMKGYLVHRIVYETFSGSPIPEGMQVNHIDEDKNNNNINNFNLMTQKQNSNWGTRNLRVSKSLINGKSSKAVGAFKDGKLVMTFPSANEAGRNGFNQGHISACCRGEEKTHKGFEWKYI